MLRHVETYFFVRLLVRGDCFECVDNNAYTSVSGYGVWRGVALVKVMLDDLI